MLAAAFALGALVVLLYMLGRDRDEPTSSNPSPPPAATNGQDASETNRSPDPPPTPEPDPNDALTQETEADDPASLESPEQDSPAGSPTELLGQIRAAFEANDMQAIEQLIGPDALTEKSRNRLHAMSESGTLPLRPEHNAREVGELELNKRNRWALKLDGAKPGRDRIFFDLRKNDDGSWQVESLTLPPQPDEDVPLAPLTDPLGIADAFIQATLRQEYQKARKFVDSSSVSDPKIATLCILFEEGKYHLRENKPLRAITGGPNAGHAGFLAYIVAADGSETAQLSLQLEKSENDQSWQVVELNLESLLSDYAKRVAGGDVYYTPLIKNPQGGDTLVLYFDFDEAQLSPRTQRQLDIVVEALRLDNTKKLTLSGHTDALGTEDYNEKLSGQRASSVKEFLVEAGVDPSQIVTQAAGQSQPRRPNFTPSGEDDPHGRRANRRTEIYLDF